MKLKKRHMDLGLIAADDAVAPMITSTVSGAMQGVAGAAFFLSLLGGIII